MKITKGKQKKAQAVVIYGVEGIGKTTFASQFPNPLFIDTEDSTTHLDVARTENPSSWTRFKQILGEFKNDTMGYQTLVIDSIDWLEAKMVENVCAEFDVSSIGKIPHGKGYVECETAWGKFLNFLIELKNSGINIVLVAHSHLKKIELPNEMGAFDKYEFKLSKKVAPLTKEFADMVLFCNFKTMVIEIDGKKKAQGAKRVMYTTHHACWDAKNRHDLKEELPLNYSQIAMHIPSGIVKEKKPEPALDFNAVEKQIQDEKEEREAIQTEQEEVPVTFNTALYDLMTANNVKEEEIRKVVALRGYYPEATPIDNYDEQFINGVLVAAWEQVFEMIKSNRI